MTVCKQSHHVADPEDPLWKEIKKTWTELYKMTEKLDREEFIFIYFEKLVCLFVAHLLSNDSDLQHKNIKSIKSIKINNHKDTADKVINK